MNKHVRAGLKTLGIGAVAMSAFWAYTNYCPFSLVYNRTASIPKGLYFAEQVSASALNRGDITCFAYHAPEWAKERRYFPEGFRLCKPIAGLAGDRVALDGHAVWLEREGHSRIRLGEFASRDTAGRPLPTGVLQAGVIPEGKALLIAGAHANSFDSRYLGLFNSQEFSLKLTPLLTFGA